MDDWRIDVFFSKKFTVKKVISLVMTFFGCVLVTGVITNPGSVNVMGVVTGLGAGLGYALYSIFSRYAIERNYHTFTITFYTFLIAAAGSIFIADIPEIYVVATQGMGTFLLCLALGIAGTVLPYLAYTLGLKYMDNGRAAIIASVEPVTATLLGVFVFGEMMNISGAAGALIVIIALLL